MARRKLVERHARDLLRSQSIAEPPVPIEQIAISLGAQIVRNDSDDDDLSGFLIRDRHHHTILIGVNPNHHPHRQRFTIAHEIGHLLLHKDEGIHVDDEESMFRIDRRDVTSAAGTDVQEREANLFAAEILMPKRFVDHAVRSFELLDENAIAQLARLFNVSSQALTFRLTALGYTGL
jgi:Zn-dependent peptidase ImmA (M78 family)